MKKFMILLLLFINVIFLMGCDKYYITDGSTIIYKGMTYDFQDVHTNGMYEFDEKTSIGTIVILPFYQYELYTLDSDEENGILIYGSFTHGYYYFEKFNYVFIDENTLIKSIGFEIEEGEYFDLNLDEESFSTLFVLDRTFEEPWENIEYENSLKHISATYIYIYYEKGMKYINSSYVDDKCIYYNIYDYNGRKDYWFKLSDKYNDLLYNKLVKYNKI